MGAWKIDVEVAGFDKLRKRLRSDPPFVAPYWKEVAEQVAAIGEVEARLRAPVRSGATRLQVASRVQQSAMPGWVRVSDRARARGRAYKRQSKKAMSGAAPLRFTRGYSYPARQAWDRTMPHYGWFQAAMKATQRRIAPLLQAAARRMEKDWSR